MATSCRTCAASSSSSCAPAAAGGGGGSKRAWTKQRAGAALPGEARLKGREGPGCAAGIGQPRWPGSSGLLRFGGLSRWQRHLLGRRQAVDGEPLQPRRRGDERRRHGLVHQPDQPRGARHLERIPRHLPERGLRLTRCSHRRRRVHRWRPRSLLLFAAVAGGGGLVIAAAAAAAGLLSAALGRRRCGLASGAVAARGSAPADARQCAACCDPHSDSGTLYSSLHPLTRQKVPLRPGLAAADLNPGPPAACCRKIMNSL